MRRAALAAVAAALTAGATLSACSSTDDAPAASATAPPTRSVAPTSAPGSLPFGRVSEPGVGPTGVRTAAVSPPVRLGIPAIGVDTSLERLGLAPDGSLLAPRAWQRAGWYSGGTAPGAVGPAIVAGHVDSTSGPAVFFRLGQLRPGDRVRVSRADGSVVHFVVDGSRTYPKARFPTSAVYGATPDAQLRLITCTGDFDSRTGNYLANLVVTAHLVG